VTLALSMARVPRAAATDWSMWSTKARLLVSDPVAASSARHIVDKELAAIDDAVNRFRSDSELSRVNAEPNRRHSVSPLFVTALRIALDAAEITQGTVDPTMGSALRQLGYDRDITEVRSRPSGQGPQVTVGVSPPIGRWREVELDDAAATVQLPTGVCLDLGATAKALAADRAGRAVTERLDVGVLVALGGDIAVWGEPPHPQGWLIQVVEQLGAPAGPSVRVTDGGVATSTVLSRRWFSAGHARHHLIDPATGFPVVGHWRTVTVAASSCVEANIASTAAVIKGKTAAAWLSHHRLPARLVRHDGYVATVGPWPGEHMPDDQVTEP
jgi:FAD:protein FMN transferase